jgi:hypothetical protein
VPQHADSLTADGAQLMQRHWIGVTPMEAELTLAGRAQPGLTSADRGAAALALREQPCYTGATGLFHTGRAGCDSATSTVKAELQTFTLNSAVMAVGEGNYGRLTAQQRYTRANRELQSLPDEQPGAMPEIAPSPDYGRSIDKPFNERASVLQAWGAYGTAWPVVRQQLGVRPDMGRQRLEVVPQVPDGQPSVAGSNIRLGAGSADVLAAHAGTTYRTVVRSGVRTVVLGHVLPRGATVASVTLDGTPVARPALRETNRGLEVTVTTGAGRHVLVVRSS